MAAATVGVRVGDPAPEFTLTSGSGAAVSLADYRDKSEVVLFFYPQSGSPACTAEACSFRDSYQAFLDAGAEVIGVSGGSERGQKRFAGAFGLPYPVLSDPGGEVRRRFGVPRTLGLVPGRVTYLIDKAGVVRHVVNSQFLPFRHVHETLRVLKELRAGA